MESNSRNCNGKSFSKSENEGFIIQKTQSLKSVFRTTIFFFITPHFTLTFTFITHMCHFFFFNTNINFIYFYFNYNTPEQRARERERERVAKRECRVGVGGNGGWWWVSKLLFGGDSGVCQFGNSNGQWWFQTPIWYCLYVEEQFNPSPRFPNIWFFNF